MRDSFSNKRKIIYLSIATVLGVLKAQGLLTIYLRVVNLMYGLTLIGKGELLSHLFLLVMLFLVRYRKNK